MNYEFSLAGKWLELLKQIAPSVTRVGVLGNYAISASTAQFAAMQVAAGRLGVEVHSLNAPHADEIEHAIASFARLPNGGIVATAGAENLHRDLVIALAERYKLPAVYLLRSTVAAGGLAAYGPDRIDQLRRAAGYVDRILKGEKPGDLPVQSPTKFNLVINLKTAKALGLAIPAAVLASADEVIE
jgi:putative ABC transport system substrate-binding protein